MENARALLENGRRRAVAGVVAGAAALTLVGCSSPEAPAEAPAAVPEVAQFDADPGVDAWPVLEADAEPVELDSSTYVGGISMAVDVESEYHREQASAGAGAYGTSATFGPYESLLNSRKNMENMLTDQLPSGRSAAVLDVKLGSDGGLRYDSHMSEHNNDAGELLGLVQANSDPLKSALRNGDIAAVHVRVFEPNQNIGLGVEEPGTWPQYIADDSNTDHRPALYLYLSGQRAETTKKLDLMIGHETEHAALGHSTKMLELTTEERQDIAAACDTLQTEAMTQVHDRAGYLHQDLQVLRKLVPAKFGPAFERVAEAMKTDTYKSLPERDGAFEELPECSWQDPLEAVRAVAEEMGLGSISIPEGPAGQRIEQAMDTLVQDWNELVKQGTVYSALNESNLLPYGSDNEQFGHSYERVREVAATTANLVMKEPDAFGEDVAELPDNQHAAIIKIAEANHATLVRRYAHDQLYVNLLNFRYGKFFAAAQRR